MVMGLGELKRNFEELKVINEKQESRVRSHETKVQNIVVGYLIWGRSFFSISQASSFLKCNDWWLILAMNLLCAFVYFLLFLDAVTMLCRTQYQLELICKELTAICQQILVAKNEGDVGLMEAGESSDALALGFVFHEKILMLDPCRIVGRKIYIYFTVCALLAVTTLELYACKYLFCK